MVFAVTPRRQIGYPRSRQSNPDVWNNLIGLLRWCSIGCCWGGVVGFWDDANRGFRVCAASDDGDVEVSFLVVVGFARGESVLVLVGHGVICTLASVGGGLRIGLWLFGLFPPRRVSPAMSVVARLGLPRVLLRFAKGRGSSPRTMLGFLLSRGWRWGCAGMTGLPSPDGGPTPAPS